LALLDCDFSVTGEATSLTTDNLVGIEINADIMMTGLSSAVFDGAAGATSAIGDSNIGLRTSGNLRFTGTSNSMTGTATGDNTPVGFQWTSGTIETDNLQTVDIIGQATPDTAGSNARGFLLSASFAETVHSSISIYGESMSSHPTRFGDVGVLWAGTLALDSDADLDIQGIGGEGLDDNIGVSFTGGSIFVAGPGCDVAIDGTGNGIGDGNFGVRFGSSFTGIDGLGVFPALVLTVAGVGSSTGVGANNHGITFEGTFETRNFVADYHGIGGSSGSNGHGIHIGPVTVTQAAFSTESVIYTGDAMDTSGYGIFCDSCVVQSVNGDVTMSGTSMVTDREIFWMNDFIHPTKISGDWAFDDFVTFNAMFDFYTYGELAFHGVDFREDATFNGTLVELQNRLEVSGTAYVTVADDSPCDVSGTVQVDPGAYILFTGAVDATGNYIGTVDGVLEWDDGFSGDSDLTMLGAGTYILSDDLYVEDLILASSATLKMDVGFIIIDTGGDQTYNGDIDLDPPGLASYFFIAISVPSTITFGGAITERGGSSELQVYAEQIVFTDGNVHTHTGSTFLSDQFGGLKKKSVDYYYDDRATLSNGTSLLAARSTLAYGDHIANLQSTFQFSAVEVADGFTLVTEGTFDGGLLLRDSTFLKAGTTLSDTGCFTASSLTFNHFSTWMVSLQGPSATTCNNQFDRASVGTGGLSIDAQLSPSLQIDTLAGAIRGETYFIAVDQGSLTGEFPNLPQGSTTSTVPVLIASYTEDKDGGAGIDFSLRVNSLPVGVDDMYTVTVPHSEPAATGVLANDSDPDFDPIFVANASPLSPSGNCLVSVNSDGSFVVSSLLEPCFGVSTFVYSLTDGYETVGPVTVTLNVIPPSPTPTGTPSMTASSTASRTSTQTGSGTPSNTPTGTPSPTNTPTTTQSESLSNTPSPSPSVTASSTFTPTSSPSSTRTPSTSASETTSPTPSTSTTETATATPSETASPTHTVTPTTSMTASTTMTHSATASPSSTASETPSVTASETQTGTPAVTTTPSPSPSSSLSAGVSPSKTSTTTLTATKTPTATPTMSKTGSQTRTTSKTGTASRTPARTVSTTPSVSKTPSDFRTPTGTPTPTRTPSKTASKTASPSSSLSAGASPSSTPSPSRTETATMTTSATRSPTSTASSSASGTVSPTSSKSPTSTATPSSSATTSPTRSASSSESSAAASASGSSTVVPPSATATQTIPQASALPTQSPAARSPSAAAAAPGVTPEASRSPSRSAIGAAVVPTFVPNASASLCIGSFCVSPNTAPAPSDIPLEVELLNDSASTVKDVRNEQGQEVGRVRVPHDSGGAVLVVNKASDNVVLIDEVVTDVVDVTVVDSNGEVVDKFDGDELEVCFSTAEFDTDDVCLGFFNEDEQWECQDYCLSSTTSDEGEELLCGNTDHLTNFALLLDTDAGSSSRCGSSSMDLLYVYLSVAFVCISIFIVSAVVISREAYHRYDAHLTDKRLTYTGSSGIRSPSGGSSEVPSFNYD